MKNILITGGYGFIGSNFLIYMVKKYKEINFYNYDKLLYCASKDNIKDIENELNFKSTLNKLQNKEFLLFYLINNNIDTIVHFAAQTHVDHSFHNSLDYTNDNIYGTHILLECCRIYGKIIKFIHMSTDEVYGESLLDDNIKKTENSILYPTNPYAATKAAAEMLIISYYKSFKLPIIIIRSNNIYGERQYIDKVIPKFINQLLNNNKCTIHGDGSCIRSFIYIDDLINCIELIMNNGVIGEIYNIGLGEEISIKDLAIKLIKMINNDDNDDDNYDDNGNEKYEKYIEYIKDRNFNDKRYYISDDKIKKLGFNIKYNLDDGLKKTIEWYKQN
jgi:dTDP-glucose 4,6-dehydratase